jgi:glycosyltransferase involved in cell wall biosynthesis
MKLIIQIPCFNEEKTLPLTVKDLPKKIPGISKIEYLVIDDGSSDNTVNVAKKCGVHHIIKNEINKGLAYTFKKGIDESIRLGANIIVNTDADNQYSGFDIPKLIYPIIKNKADIVVGTRPILSHQDFTFVKKILQVLGSYVVRILSGTDVKDAPSGFRAYSIESAMKINIFSNYTYTLETLIQAGQQGERIISVPIKVNSKLRESRLFKGMFQYISRSLATLVRIFAVYRPLMFFGFIGIAFLFIGFIPLLRYFYLYLNNQQGDHLQSIVLGTLLIIIGFFAILAGFVGDIISVNRKLLEEIKVHQKKLLQK